MKLKYSLFALIALAVAGCQKAPVYDDVVYIAGAEGEVPTLSLTLDDQFPKELSVKGLVVDRRRTRYQSPARNRPFENRRVQHAVR